MIPTLMMIAGGIVGLFGLLWTLYIAITPILVKMRSINGEGELVETARIRRIRIRDRKYLIKISLSMLLVGLLVLFSGVYLGYAEKGDGFWFYRLVHGTEDAGWDKLTEDGSYIADDGSIYKFYLIVNADGYELCGETCADIEDLTVKLRTIKRENTIILIDNYASYEAYKAAEEILTDLGIGYETEEI